MPDKKESLSNVTKHNDVLENYFRNTIIPQLFVDGSLKLQKFTPPAMKHFSLSDSDVGRSITEIKENFRFPSIIENIESVIKTGEILEKEIQTTDFRWYQMNIIPYIRMQDNKTDGVIITFVEITRRIQDLKEQEKIVADHEILLDTISHDIKNPLTNLVTAIGLFKNVSPSDKAEFDTLLKVVDNALTKMHKLIEELTENRSNDYHYKAVEELLNFEHVVEDVRLILSENIIEADAKIIIDIEVSEITFSRRKLRSIIYNLVNNALKFKDTKRPVTIKVSTYLKDDNIILCVKDNGIGIEENKLEEIFSKYYRVENAIEGSGIGLYLVKEIVKNAGGEITVNSEVGKGTEFIITFKK